MSKKNETAAAAVKEPAPAEAKASPLPDRFVPASEQRFATSSEFRFPLTSYVPVAGTPFEHLLRPEYWANLKRLQAGCEIKVVAEDNSYYARLYVDRVGQGYAQVLTLEYFDLTELRSKAVKPQASAEGTVYNIEHCGPVTKWRVVRVRDGHVLKDKLETDHDAQGWLRDYKRAVAA